eukprot:1638815-Amphidinium_carterae.1
MAISTATSNYVVRFGFPSQSKTEVRNLTCLRDQLPEPASIHNSSRDKRCGALPRRRTAGGMLHHRLLHESVLNVHGGLQPTVSVNLSGRIPG